jgi:riboflavin biosynthesis pyrimidine reductase
VLINWGAQNGSIWRAASWLKRVGNPLHRGARQDSQVRRLPTLTEPLPWQNSTLLTDPVQQVPGLKRERDLVILGSGALIQSLSRAGLIDAYLLPIHPLVLGADRRLFPPHAHRPS